jgi:hypothetical protein
MSDRKITLRAYSQDRENYRRQNRSMDTKISTNYNKTSDNYYSNRNCPEMLSIFALTNKSLDHRVKEIYRSTANDNYNFHMINYPIESPSTSPIPNLESENDKQPKLPILTPRVNIKDLYLSLFFWYCFLDCCCREKDSYINKKKYSFKSR